MCAAILVKQKSDIKGEALFWRLGKTSSLQLIFTVICHTGEALLKCVVLPSKLPTKTANWVAVYATLSQQFKQKAGTHWRKVSLFWLII